jgi:hypothetical protein
MEVSAKSSHTVDRSHRVFVRHTLAYDSTPYHKKSLVAIIL